MSWLDRRITFNSFPIFAATAIHGFVSNLSATDENINQQQCSHRRALNQKTQHRNLLNFFNAKSSAQGRNINRSLKIEPLGNCPSVGEARKKSESKKNEPSDLLRH